MMIPDPGSRQTRRRPEAWARAIRRCLAAHPAAATVMSAGRKPAAVLIPLVQREQRLSVLFTVRADNLKHHAGQISFPGGRVERTDGTEIDTACRETFEEIGVRRQFISVLGTLDRYRSSSGYDIRPVVGLLRSGVEFRLRAQEVQEVFDIPLDFLLQPNNYTTVIHDWHNRAHYRILYRDKNVWGVTAGILYGFCSKLWHSAHF